MKFLQKMERKFGRYAISNLTLYIIITYVAAYAIYYLGGNMISYLYLDPYLIFHGQIWRLVSWILVPPESLNIFTVIMLFFYYSLGTALERTWGDFRYNVYIFGGLFWTIIGALILYIAMFLIYGQWVQFGAFAGSFSTYYVSLSIFLGFALTYPDMQVMLYFIIPLKIKYLAYVDVAFLLLEIAQSVMNGDWARIVVIVCSLMNTIIYFLITRNYRRIDPREINRKRQYKKAVNPSRAGHAGTITRHKCAICGRTELDDPTLEFRFCSKCRGNYEYCQNHLFTHTHIQ